MPKNQYEEQPTPGIWTEEPEETNTNPTLPIIRPGKKHGWKIVALILSDKVLGTYTHFASRTRPCTAPTGHCTYCQRGLPKRWLGYLHVLKAPTKTPALLEITGKIAAQLAEHRRTNTTLRGSQLTITKTTERTNAPTNLEDIQPQVPPAHPNLPPAADIAELLERIWK